MGMFAENESEKVMDDESGQLSEEDDMTSIGREESAVERYGRG